MAKKVVTLFLIFLSLSFFVTITPIASETPPLPTGSITRAPLPELRADLPAVAHNGLVYVFGGYHDSWSLGQAETFAYDPVSDSWTQKTSMNYPRWGEAATIYNDEAYVFGGSYQGYASSAVEAYNFALDSWEIKQDLPANVFNQGLEAVTVGSQIYLFYGTSTYSYNPQTGEYTQLASAPYDKDWAECAYVNVNGEDRIYLLGGYDLPNWDATNTCAYYRPAYDDWVTIGAAPYGAYGTLRDNPVIDGTIFYGYGQGQHDSKFYDYMYSYNPASDAWTQLPSGIYPRDGVACAVLGSKLYVIGGRSTWDDPIMGLDYNEEFDTGLFSQPTLVVNPPTIRMYLNQSQTFSATTYGGTPPYSYKWYLNGTLLQNQNDSNFTFTPTIPGNYRLFARVTDSNGQTARSNTISDFVVYNQFQPDLLIPDWSNVNKDFFTLVPGTVEPVLTAADVTDRAADFVADPFIYHENGLWYMFMEVHWSGVDYSEVGLATSNNGFDWSYQQIVLSESFNLAYPYIFKWNGTYYMIPETYSQSEVRLYKATDFPYGWEYVSSILSKQSFNPVDSSVFRYNNMWWMFTSSESDLGYLYYSNSLEDPSAWHMHPMSPITTDNMKVRGAGRTVVFDNDHIIRLTQELYGRGVRAFEVDTLTTTAYAEHEVNGSPLVEATFTSGWNAQAMHTVNPWWSGNGWVVAVDGAGYDWLWSIGIYVTPLQPSITPSAVSIDVGQSQEFASTVIGGRPPYTYQWYMNGNPVSGATGAKWTFTPTQSGQYNVYVSVADSLNNQAVSNVVRDITVYGQPSVTISPVSANITLGGSQQFNSAVSGGLAPYTYQWYYANGTAISGAITSTLEYKADFTGTYSIYLSVTDSLTFTFKSNTGIISVYPKPVVTINPTLVNMEVGKIQQFNSSVTGGLAPYIYQWYYANGSTITGATNPTLTFKANFTGTYNIYLNVTDNLNSKTQSNIATINIYSQPAVLINPTSVNMTLGTTQQFTSTTTGGLIPYAYQWYQNDTAVTGATASTWNFTPAAAGHYKVYLNVTDALNSKVQSNIVADITVNSQPTVTISPINVNMTTGAPQTFVSNLTNGTAPYSYQWYLNRTAVSGATTASWTFTPIMAGTYKIYLNVTDHSAVSVMSNNATANVQTDITVNIAPTQVKIYAGQNQTFSSSVLGGTQPYIYQWCINDTAVLGANNSNWTFTPISAGSYRVYLNLTDALNIKVQSNIVTDITVYAPLTVSINPSSVNMTVGIGQTFNSTVSGGESPYTYQWYLNGSLVPNANANTWTFIPTSTGNFSIYLMVADNKTASAQSNNATITVETQINVTIAPTQARIYLEQSVNFNSTVSGGIAPYSYQWYLNNTAVIGATSQNWIFAPNFSGNYTVFLKVTDALNLLGQSNLVTNITVYSQLSVSINPNSVNMTVGTPQTFYSTALGGAQPYSYQWYLNGSQIPNAKASTWVFIPTSPGNFNVYLMVADNNTAIAQSNNATLIVEAATNVTIMPFQVRMYIGQSQTFNSIISGGNSPYSYQWYLNDTAVLGATSQNWTLTPNLTGHYKIYLNITDALNIKTQSNIVTDVIVYSALTALISPSTVNMTIGMQQTFNSTVSGGAQPYTYQWYLNGNPVPNTNSSTWTFIPNASGNFTIYLKITDNNTQSIQSNNATVITIESTLVITGFILESGGSGYTTPHVVLTGGGGTGATAVARVSQGVVIGLILTNPGSGYTSAPTVTLRDPSPRAKGAAATAEMSTL